MSLARRITATWRPAGIPLAWRQLMGEKKRFAVAVLGVAFAVVLMLFQVGVFRAFMVMVVRPIEALRGDLVIISRDMQYLMTTASFPERRLTQTEALPEVRRVYPVRLAFCMWRNPDCGKQYELALFGIRRDANPFILPEIESQLEVLSLPDGALYDAQSSPEYGDVRAHLKREPALAAEVNRKRLRVLGTFSLGQTLAAYGTVLVGAETFQRLDGRAANLIELGMIELAPDANPQAVADRLTALLPDDVDIITRAAFIRREQAYWQANTPIGFIVIAGLVIALFVGAVIVYQILYTDINDHLREYATLKAMGMSDGFFTGLLVQEACILPAFGVPPGLLLTYGLFRLAETVGGLPTRLNLTDTVFVCSLTVIMCIAAGLIATRRLRAADPSDIF